MNKAEDKKIDRVTIAGVPLELDQMYDGAWVICNLVILVTNGEKYGLLSSTGKIILPLEYTILIPLLDIINRDHIHIVRPSWSTVDAYISSLNEDIRYTIGNVNDVLYFLIGKEGMPPVIVNAQGFVVVPIDHSFVSTTWELFFFNHHLFYKYSEEKMSIYNLEGYKCYDGPKLHAMKQKYLYRHEENKSIVTDYNGNVIYTFETQDAIDYLLPQLFTLGYGVGMRIIDLTGKILSIEGYNNIYSISNLFIVGVNETGWFDSSYRETKYTLMNCKGEVLYKELKNVGKYIHHGVLEVELDFGKNYVDLSGNMLLENPVTTIYDFNDYGLACISYNSYGESGNQDNNIWGVINSRYDVILPCTFYRVKPIFDFEKKRIKTAQGEYLFNGQFVSFNGKKEIILPKCYLYSGEFIDGLAIVCKIKNSEYNNHYHCYYYNYEYGVINDNLDVIIPPIYHSILLLENGLYQVEIDNFGKTFGLINKSGIVVAEPRYTFAPKFENGYAVLTFDDKKNERYLSTIIDETGRNVLCKDSEYMSKVFDGIRTIRNNGDWFLFFESTISIKAVNNATKVGVFKEGMCRYNINGQQKTNSDGVIIVDGGQWGYLDLTGNTIITPQYECALNFSSGFATIKGNSEWEWKDITIAAVKKDGKWGYIDAEGKMVINTDYLNVKSFNGGFLIVKKEEGWGAIDILGNEIIPFKYSKITDGYQCIINNNEDWYTLGINGELNIERKDIPSQDISPRNGSDADYQDSDWDFWNEIFRQDFWDECGESGSNCESWPGWD